MHGTPLVKTRVRVLVRVLVRAGRRAGRRAGVGVCLCGRGTRHLAAHLV